MRKSHYRRRKNPLSFSGVASLVTLSVVGVGAYFAWQWLKKNKGAIDPTSTKNVVYQGANRIARIFSNDPTATVGTAIADVAPSRAERTVNSMYGPGQGFRNAPVYNTPGKPGYIPGLPPSYAPGSKPTYYDMGQKMPLVTPEAPPDEPILTGLGRWL